MDDLDIRIFKELGSPSSLQWNVRETYSNIARRVGVDEETVRRRVKRAEKLGSVAGWRMMINPHLIGCDAAGIDLQIIDEERKDKAVGEIARIDGVTKILDYRGKGLQVTLYYPDDNARKRKTELIKSICSSPEDPTVWNMEFPHSNVKLTITDWEIVQTMLEDARKSLATVSKSTGVSVRTISRRLTSLIEEHAVYLQGTPNFRNFSGLACVFLVYCPDRKEKRVVDDLVLSKAPRIEIFNTSSKQHSTFVTMFDNLIEVDEFDKWIRTLEGVKNVKMGVMKELIIVQDWLRDEIGRRISG